MAPTLSQPYVTDLSAGGSDTGLSPETPLSNLLSLAGPTPFSEAIAVGTHYPPVPKKIVRRYGVASLSSRVSYYQAG